MCVMNFAIEKWLSFWLAGLWYTSSSFLRLSEWTLSFDDLKTLLLKKCFSDENFTKQ